MGAGRCVDPTRVETRRGQTTGEQTMRTWSRYWAGAAVCLAALVAAVWAVQPPAVHGQEKSKAAKKPAKGTRTKPLANTKNLDVKADQIQSSFTKEAEDLAG